LLINEKLMMFLHEQLWPRRPCLGGVIGFGFEVPFAPAKDLSAAYPKALGADPETPPIPRKIGLNS
jgi:hypothetical protein